MSKQISKQMSKQMPKQKKCDMNKNRLLTLHFHEGTAREEQDIQNHVDQCADCREYLRQLEQTDRALQGWKDESPLPGTLDTILANIPQKQLKPAAAKPSPSIPVIPLVLILVSIIALTAGIAHFHDKITLLPIWETMQAWAPVKLLGSFGVTAVVLFLFGVFITLSLAPVLIMDVQTKKNKYLPT
jgi:uncharacterized membrane protein YidH (DUF202 family)